MGGRGDCFPRMAASESSNHPLGENDYGVSKVLSPLVDLVLDFKITIRRNRPVKKKTVVAQLHLHEIKRLPKDLGSFEWQFTAAWGIHVSKMKIRFWDRKQKIFVIQFESREDQQSVLKGNPWDINGAPLTLMPFRPEMTSFAEMRMVHPPWVFPKGKGRAQWRFIDEDSRRYYYNY